jgi:hypothetical protein
MGVLVAVERREEFAVYVARDRRLTLLVCLEARVWDLKAGGNFAYANFGPDRGRAQLVQIGLRQRVVTARLCAAGGGDSVGQCDAERAGSCSISASDGIYRLRRVRTDHSLTKNVPVVKLWFRVPNL